ncbi:hypothetical protein J3A84_05470 [Proteiniclasticum sp. SCR006]|uniref:Uncharacterized protein n=1 Tax=Proteiniclasticum aestuarii TaxID=2817862 RepID=A0A939HBX3_9CLOT|nr:hypothetical protein [Proteiniclasticum aestuarii]MBO1264488.1 hypothetical protein [Proteiniclasticum aestuarii]
MIDTKIHALEVLNYVLSRSSEKDKKEIIRKSMVELKKFEFKIDEEVFFKEILKRKDGLKFMQSNGILTLEELVMKQYEYRMKYEWGLYKKIPSMIDINEDDLDESYYLD